MTYKIIGDSCLDLTEELKRDPRFQMVPLTLQVGAAQVVDDETFDQKAFIRMVKECPECPKTACPSPEIFKEAYEAADAEAVFVITLSSHLSGSYNSAALAKQLYEEEMKEKGITSSKKIEVLDSESASAGQLDRHIHRRKARRSALDLLGQKQKPRARSIHRKPCRNLCPKRLIKPQLIQELTHRGTLAARQNQSVHRPLQIRKLPDLKRLCAQSPYHGNVFGKRALHRQHAYLFFLHLTVPALPSKSQSHSH